MPEPVGVNRPPAYRPAATQPLDPAVVERVTQELKSSALAKTTPLDPVEKDVRLPGFLGTVQDFVSSLFGGSKTSTSSSAAASLSRLSAPPGGGTASIALPQDGKEGRLPGSEPSGSASATVRDWKAMVSKEGGAAPAAAPGSSPAAALPPESRPATRSWGMVSMDGAKVEDAVSDARQAAPGMFRNWGMVSLTEDQKAPATEAVAETPQVFRTWGMVGMKEPEAPTIDRPAPEPPKVEPPRAEPPKAEPPKAEPPKAEPPKAEPPKAEPPKAEPPGVESALNAETRTALMAKVRAALGPDAVLLDRLEAKGILDKTGPSGKTVLELLAEMPDLQLSEEARRLGFTPESVLKQTVSDLANPMAIQQQGENDCVWTNLRFFLSRDKQGEYVEAALALYRDGKVTIEGGGQVKLEEALEPFDLGGTVGKVWYKDGSLWLQYKGFPAMPMERFVTGFLNNREWIDEILAKNRMLDNPFFRAFIDNIRTMWNEGKRDEVMQTIAPFIELYINSQPEEKQTSGIRYALQNIRALFKPAAQSTEALPKGVALGKVDDFMPGLKGYYVNGSVLDYLVMAAARGAQVPVAFQTDDGEGLHMATIIGRSPDGQILIYDPEDGPRSIPESLLRERAVAAFAPPDFGDGLRMVPDTDTRPVGGGRFGRRFVGG